MIPITPTTILAGVSGLALACALSFAAGHHQKTLEDASVALKGALKTVQVVQHQSAVNSTVDQHAVASLAKVQTDTASLVQKVPIYVTRKSDDQCIIGVGARSLLDAAATGAVPAAPSGLPDADSGLALSSVISDNLVNAGSYREAVTKGSTWDDWYDAQNPDWKRDHPTPDAR